MKHRVVILSAAKNLRRSEEALRRAQGASFFFTARNSDGPLKNPNPRQLKGES
jgi:hypothetical protein